MKKNIFTLLLLIFTLGAFSQQKIKNKIKKSIPLLTQYITKDLTSDKQKAEAIYKWITENIAYNYEKLDDTKYYSGVDPKKILKQKKAICGGYVELTRAMLAEVGIKSETVTGYIHDIHWSPGLLIVSESHAWISIKIEGKWLLADPTWDAGYIGRIHIKRKLYAPKQYKKNEWKKQSKTIYKEKKRSEKEIIRKENYDNKPKYTEQIGFVKDPKIDIYLIESDTFLLSHLPILPILPFWQLRDSMLTIEEFSQSQDSIKKILASKKYSQNKCNKFITEFTKENFLNQLIISGEKGNEFNPYNPGIKALYYYNYLSLVQSKNLQRLARGSKYEITKDKYPELSVYNDTVIKYVAAFKGFEKSNFKLIKTFDKEKFKLSQSCDKTNDKLISKLKSLNNKVIGKIENNTLLLESSIEKSKTIIDQIASDYSKSLNYSKPKKFKDKFIHSWDDSISIYTHKLEKDFYLLDSLRKKTNFKTILNLCGSLEYLYEVNADYIQFNSYSTEEITNEIDSLITDHATRMIRIFNDSIMLELLNKQILSNFKKVVSLGKMAKADFNLLEKENKIDVAYKYELYIQSKVYKLTKLMETNYLRSLSFNEQVLIALGVNKKNLKTVFKLREEQTSLKESKYDFISEKTEKSHIRSSDLVEKIKKDAKEWKKKFKI